MITIVVSLIFLALVLKHFDTVVDVINFELSIDMSDGTTKYVVDWSNCAVSFIQIIFDASRKAIEKLYG